DGADLLDVERAVGETLAPGATLAFDRQQPIKDAQDAAVRDVEHTRRIALGRAPFEEQKNIGIEEFAAAGLDEMRSVPGVDQPEQREHPPPAAAPLVHRVGIERGVLDE